MGPKDEVALYDELRDAATDEDTRIIAGVMAAESRFHPSAEDIDCAQMIADHVIHCLKSADEEPGRYRDKYLLLAQRSSEACFDFAQRIAARNQERIK